ncbi:unnamed protein product, partial [Mesorhabditis spiculigera]
MSWKSAKELTAFAGLIITMHMAYYAIQNNPGMVPPHARQELFYVRWLKEKIPALQGYGIKGETRDDKN